MAVVITIIVSSSITATKKIKENEMGKACSR
jgi:hypothetical protein